jgi:glutathione peroxidase
MSVNIYEYNAKTLKGEEKSLSSFKDKVLLIVNTASKCGLTPQFEGLQALYEKYRERGFEVLGFPSNQFAEQEPGTAEEIQKFCQLNYGVSFTMFDKVEVNGPNAHPLYQALTSPEGAFPGDIEWNFAKFLVNREGEAVERFSPKTLPSELEKNIEALL